MRITPAPTASTEPTKKQQALDDPHLPPLLKDLAERIIPQRLEGEFRSLVDSGALDPLMICEAQPLLSPVPQVMGLPAEDSERWLKILFAHDLSKLAEAKCPCLGFRSGYFSTDPDFKQSYYTFEVETPLLSSVLMSRNEKPVVELAKFYPGFLAARIPDRYNNAAEEPLLHNWLSTNDISVRNLDLLETLTGGTDFLLIRNSRGETLFHRISANSSWAEDQGKLDLASWMLQRRPELVNTPDRFGWTPLDRMLSNSQGKYDTSMGRLLVVSGAHLEKQLAPKFNLEAELEEREGGRLGKPVPKKAAGLSKVL